MQTLSTSLRQDSSDVERIIKTFGKSLKAQELIIKTDAPAFSTSFTPDESFQLFTELRDGVLSFFPRFGIYNLIVDNNYLNLLESDQLKTDLINHYEYRYTRYSTLDAEVQEMFDRHLIPLLTRELGCVFEIDGQFDHEKLEGTYERLQEICRNLYGVSHITLDFLRQIKTANAELIRQIEEELE